MYIFIHLVSSKLGDSIIMAFQHMSKEGKLLGTVLLVYWKSSDRRQHNQAFQHMSKEGKLLGTVLVVYWKSSDQFCSCTFYRYFFLKHTLIVSDTGFHSTVLDTETKLEVYASTISKTTEPCMECIFTVLSLTL